MRTKTTLSILLCVVGWGCAGATPPPAGPSADPSPSEATSAAPSATDTPAAAAPVTEKAAAASAPSPKIVFPPNASVEDAIKAVPQGLPRLNMSDDALNRPLMDMTAYETCKVARGQHATLRVAVYDGAAVGIEVTTKPKNAKIDACLGDVLRRMTWEKVASLNIVTFNL